MCITSMHKTSSDIMTLLEPNDEKSSSAALFQNNPLYSPVMGCYAVYSMALEAIIRAPVI